MKGRKEHEEKIDRKVKKMLENCPSYMMDFYYSLFNKSYTTRKNYISYTLDFISYLENEFAIDIKDINSFKEVSTGMINYYMNSLQDVGEGIKRCRLFGIKNFFKYLVNADVIDKNPADAVEPPKDRKERKVTALNKEEIKVVRESIINGGGSDLAKARQKEWTNRDNAIITLAILLGLRVTALTEINIEDINFDSNELIVTEKNNKTRILIFGDQLKTVLETWMEDRERMLNKKNKECNALFISNRLSRISVGAVRNLVDKYTSGVDKHISPHKLRATCATMLYDSTKDLELTRRMLGHNSSQTTQRYIGINEEEKQRATSALESAIF